MLETGKTAWRGLLGTALRVQEERVISCTEDDNALDAALAASHDHSALEGCRAPLFIGAC